MDRWILRSLLVKIDRLTPYWISGVSQPPRAHPSPPPDHLQKIKPPAPTASVCGTSVAITVQRLTAPLQHVHFHSVCCTLPPHLHLLCLRAPWRVFISKLITNGGEYLQWSLRVIYHQAPPSLFDSATMPRRSRGAVAPYFSIFIRYVTRWLRTELKREHGEWNGKAARGG